MPTNNPGSAILPAEIFSSITLDIPDTTPPIPSPLPWYLTLQPFNNTANSPGVSAVKPLPRAISSGNSSCLYILTNWPPFCYQSHVDVRRVVPPVLTPSTKLNDYSLWSNSWQTWLYRTTYDSRYSKNALSRIETLYFFSISVIFV